MFHLDVGRPNFTVAEAVLAKKYDLTQINE